MSPKDSLPRLSEKEMNVIEQLIQKSKYGLEIVAGSEGLLARNAIYVLLGRMEDKGLISSKEEPTPQGEMGPPRRVYKVTGHGARACHAHSMWLAALQGAR
jgi:DNA-binding PadR family transcriptional regulator